MFEKYCDKKVENSLENVIKNWRLAANILTIL